MGKGSFNAEASQLRLAMVLSGDGKAQQQSRVAEISEF